MIKQIKKTLFFAFLASTGLLTEVLLQLVPKYSVACSVMGNDIKNISCSYGESSQLRSLKK